MTMLLRYVSMLDVLRGVSGLLFIAASSCGPHVPPHANSSRNLEKLERVIPCAHDQDAARPHCLHELNYGRLLFENPDSGLRVYERCVFGHVDEGAVVFEVPGTTHDVSVDYQILSAIRPRLTRLMPEVAFVNYIPCLWDSPPACLRVETWRKDRATALRLAPYVFETISEERRKLGKDTACIPVNIVRWPGPGLLT